MALGATPSESARPRRLNVASPCCPIVWVARATTVSRVRRCPAGGAPRRRGRGIGIWSLFIYAPSLINVHRSFRAWRMHGWEDQPAATPKEVDMDDGLNRQLARR